MLSVLPPTFTNQLPNIELNGRRDLRLALLDMLPNEYTTVQVQTVKQENGEYTMVQVQTVKQENGEFLVAREKGI